MLPHYLLLLKYLQLEFSIQNYIFLNILIGCDWWNKPVTELKYFDQVWKCPKKFNTGILIICVFIYFPPPHLLSPSLLIPVTNRSHLLRAAWWCTCGPPPQALSPTPSRDQSCRSISLSSSAPPLTPILAVTLPTPPLPLPPSPLLKGQRMAWRWATHCKYR